MPSSQTHSDSLSKGECSWTRTVGCFIYKPPLRVLIKCYTIKFKKSVWILQCHCWTEVQWPGLPLQQVEVKDLLHSSVHQKASSPSEGASFFPAVAEGSCRDWAPDGGGTSKHLKFDRGLPAFPALEKQPAHTVLSETGSRGCHCQFLRRHWAFPSNRELCWDHLPPGVKEERR